MAKAGAAPGTTAGVELLLLRFPRSNLFASPQTFQTLVDLACFILQPTATPRHTSTASYGHSCSQQAPHGHTSMASYGHPSLPFASSLAANRHPRATHQWLLMGVQVCRLPALQPLKPSKRLKRSKPLNTVKPVKRWLRVTTLQTLKNRKTRKTLASRASSCSQQAPQGHTSMASYGHPSLPFASSLAANRHPRATHQWLLMGVQVCRLPALKPLKPSKRLKRSKPLNTVKPVKRWLRVTTLQTLTNRKTRKTLASRASSCSQQPPRATHQWLLMATLAANRHPRATHQWLLMGIQVCRLPALLQPTGTPGPHINGFLWASKSAVCPP